MDFLKFFGKKGEKTNLLKFFSKKEEMDFLKICMNLLGTVIKIYSRVYGGEDPLESEGFSNLILPKQPITVEDYIKNLQMTVAIVGSSINESNELSKKLNVNLANLSSAIPNDDAEKDAIDNLMALADAAKTSLELLINHDTGLYNSILDSIDKLNEYL